MKIPATRARTTEPKRRRRSDPPKERRITLPARLELVAWLPAPVFPAAMYAQLHAAVRASDRPAISATTWALFGMANLGALVLARPEELVQWLQAGVGFGLTAALDFAIVVVVRIVPRATGAGG